MDILMIKEIAKISILDLVEAKGFISGWEARGKKDAEICRMEKVPKENEAPPEIEKYTKAQNAIAATIATKKSIEDKILRLDSEGREGK